VTHPSPLATPSLGGVYSLPGCTLFMGYKYDWQKRALNQEDNQDPQPTAYAMSTWRNRY
jgi:hypothetical protein